MKKGCHQYGSICMDSYQPGLGYITTYNSEPWQLLAEEAMVTYDMMICIHSPYRTADFS